MSDGTGIWSSGNCDSTAMTRSPDLPSDDDSAGLADYADVIPDEIAAGHAVALSHAKELATLLVSYSATGG
jgi:hypothetical protein